MDTNIFRQYQEFKESQFNVELVDNIDSVDIYCSEDNHLKIMEILDEEYFEYQETDFGFNVTDLQFNELVEILSEYDFSGELNEASPVRKTVVRGGRKKVIFKCPPGNKRIKRRCVRRPAAELARVKRGARKAARKSRSKKARAARRRKVSLKRRAAFAKRRHK
jgi:hypothetical protein